MPKVAKKTSKSGKKPPIIRPRYIEISLTAKCNFNCDFCFNRGTLGRGAMSFEDFKIIIDGLQKAGLRGVPVCLGGGEPFLNPDAHKMVQYAVRRLGRENVSITTNGSMLPASPKDARRFIGRLHGAQINISIDREHLRFGKTRPEQIQVAIQAAKHLRNRISIISVARNEYEQAHPFPEEIDRVLPERLKAGAEIRMDYGSPLNESFREQYEHWKKRASGHEGIYTPMSLFYDLGIWPSVLGTPEKRAYPAIEFCPNHKVRISPPRAGLRFPQLSLGNWKREPMTDILGKNLMQKREMLEEWMGFTTASWMEKRMAGVPDTLPQRAALFARTRARAYKKQAAMRGHVL